MLRGQESPRLSFFILCFGAFIDWMSYGLVYPIFAILFFQDNPIFLADTSIAMRGLWLGVLLGSTPLAQFLTSPFTGALSDQIGRKRTLQITSLIIIIGYFISAFAVMSESFFLLIFGRLITGVGASNIAVINSSVADFSPPEAKAKNFALITMSNGIGFTVGPFMGGYLSSWGFDIPFLIASILTIINLLLYTYVFRETYEKNKGRIIGLVSRTRHLLTTISLPKFRVVFFAFLIFCLGWSFYWEFIPVTWIKIYDLNASQIGNFYAYGSAFYVISSGLLIRPIVKYFKSIPILIIALAVLGVSLFFPLTGDLKLYWFCIPIQQFLITLIFPVGTAVISNAVIKSQQGETLGAFQSMQSFAFATTPLLGGILLDLNNSIPLILGGSAAFLACFILFVGYKKKLIRD